MTPRCKKCYSRVNDVGMDLSQGLDLHCTEAALRGKTISVSNLVRDEEVMDFLGNFLSLPLVGVDHKLVEVGVFFDYVQRHHLCDVGFCVPQLVQFQVDSKHVFPDSI